MRPGDGGFANLRLAAKAADRQKAACDQWPTFEARLRALGYGPRAIAHAFSALSGPGDVPQALQVLKHTDRSSPPVELSFVICDPPSNYSTGTGMTVTSVQRDDRVLRVSYDLGVMPSGVDAAFEAHGPGGEAKDDLGNVYRSLGGGFVGLAASNDPLSASAGACGGFLLPPPDPAASELRIRVTWNATVPHMWDEEAREAVVSLQN
jgi:hypothetical protein